MATDFADQPFDKTDMALIFCIATQLSNVYVNTYPATPDSGD
jgi:hypothetical protein